MELRNALYAFSDGMYNAVTDVVSGFVGIAAPVLAAQYRHKRGMNLSYAAATRKGAFKKTHERNESADSHIKKDWQEATARARALFRNNPELSGALRKIVNNVIFKGINPQAQLMHAGNPDETRNKAFERDYKRWAKAVKFRSKQKLVVRHLWSDGGIFVRFFASPTLMDRKIVPLGVELLEIDHLDRAKEEDLENGNRIRSGIEYSPDGFEVAYWLFPQHPGGLRMFSKYISQSQRVDASLCLFVRDPERASQSLPMSWVASAVMTMLNLNEYHSSEQIAARIGAAMTVFIKQAPGTPGAPGNDLNGNPTFAPGETTDGKKKIPSFVDSGGIHEIPGGYDVDMVANPRPGNNYAAYTKVNQRRASSTFGMSYESFSNDFSDASYSSVRQAILEERRSYQEQQQLMIEEMLDPSIEIFILFRVLFNFGTEREVPVVWQLPGWDWVDPMKDAAAYEKLLEMNVANEYDLAASRGSDLEENVEKRARAKKLIESKLGTPDKEQDDAKAA